MKAILAFFMAAALYGQTFINGSRTQQGPTNYCADAGSSDAYACSLSPAIVSYAAGNVYRFKANTANTGAASLNLNALGAVTIKKVAGGVTTDLSDNDIRVNQVVEVLYDGANFQMLSQLGNAAGGGGSSVVDTSANPVMLWPGYTGGSNIQMVGSANYGWCHRLPLTYSVSSTGIVFVVGVASGTGCTGGTCGAGFAIYNSAGSAIAYSEIGYSGHSTDTKNINTTGAKILTWASGSAVSGGVLSLSPASYFVCGSSDSTALQYTAMGTASWHAPDNTLIANSHGAIASFSTGNGASLSLTATKSGSFTAGWSDVTPLMWFY